MMFNVNRVWIKNHTFFVFIDAKNARMCYLIKVNKLQ